MIKEAAKFPKEKDAYGFRAWSVTPAGGGEWDPECDTTGAPGLQSMCESVEGASRFVLVELRVAFYVSTP
jgi:hypothetical protein